MQLPRVPGHVLKQTGRNGRIAAALVVNPLKGWVEHGRILAAIWLKLLRGMSRIVPLLGVHLTY